MGAPLPMAMASSMFGVAFMFGVSFGVLARAAGFPGWQAVLMSGTVFGGSAQFAAVSVIAAGGGCLPALVSGSLLNARYIPTGVAVAPSLPGGRIARVLLAQLVIDESYALGVAAGQPGRPDGRVVIRSGIVLWCGWVGGTLVGTLVGELLGDPAHLGLDAAFPALFLALLWPMVRDDRGNIRAALVGAAVGLVLA